MTQRKSRRRGPIVLPGQPPARKPRAVTRANLLAHDELEKPLPGELLVLLSRLHRTDRRGPSEGETG